MKISRIRRVRSRMRQGMAFSILRVCDGESSSSKITTSICCSPAVTGDLFQLARADVYAGRRLRQPLRKAFHTHDIGRFGQEFEFVEELFGLPRILVVADNGDHHGALSAIGNGLGVRGYILILSQSRTLNFKQSHRAATCGREGAPCGEQTLCYKKGYPAFGGDPIY